MSWAALSGTVRRRLRATVLARDGYVCQLAYPGVCIYRATEADHIRPRETHGDGLENLRASCKPCNQHRGRPGKADPDLPDTPGRWW